MIWNTGVAPQAPLFDAPVMEDLLKWNSFSDNLCANIKTKQAKRIAANSNAQFINSWIFSKFWIFSKNKIKINFL